MNVKCPKVGELTAFGHSKVGCEGVSSDVWGNCTSSQDLTFQLSKELSKLIDFMFVA